MRAEAIVEVERRDGRSTCTRLRSDPPVSLRAAAGAVYLVGSGAGPLGGDEVTVRVRVGPGARLTLRSVAATLVLPGPVPGPSSTHLEVEVEAGGHLDLALEPLIVGGRADHEATGRIALAPGATLRWRDEVVLGRHGEAGGSLHQRVRVTWDDRPLWVTELGLGPRWPGWAGPGGIDGARALGSVLWVGCRPGAVPVDGIEVPGARGAVLDLGRGAALASVVAATPGAVRAWLGAVDEGHRAAATSADGPRSKGRFATVEVDE